MTGSSQVMPSNREPFALPGSWRAEALPCLARRIGLKRVDDVDGGTRRRPQWASSIGKVLGAVLLVTSPLVTAGCGASGPPPVLVVGGVGYGDVELGMLSGAEREDLATLTAFGLAVSRQELNSLAAPLVARERQRTLLRRLSTEISLRELGIDEAALESLYAADPEYELTVRHLVILSERWRSDEERRRARARAEEALREVKGGADFVDVASRYSEEPGAAERGGLLEPGRRGTWVDEFWRTAVSLEPGSISEVIETTYGFHVLRLEDRRVIPLEEVRYDVVGRLVDLEGARPAADAWIARYTASLEIDESAALDWRRGALPGETALASWPGGAFRAADLTAYLSTLDAEGAARFRESSDATYLEVVRALARNAMLMSYAEEIGLRLSEREEAEVAESVVTRFREQGAALGFRQGAQPAAIKETALRVLSSTAQREMIARREVLAVAPTIRALYPVEFVESD